MCVYMHSRFIENHPIWILEDGPLISEVVLSHNANNREASNAENPPPPPPPTLEQVLIIQAHMLQTMVNMQAQPHGQQSPQEQRDKLGQFQRTKSPTFSHSMEPMDVDDWLKSIENKLQVV
jgi:hypothetical protein